MLFEICLPAWQSLFHNTCSNLFSNLSSLPGIVSVLVNSCFAWSSFRICYQLSYLLFWHYHTFSSSQTQRLDVHYISLILFVIFSMVPIIKFAYQWVVAYGNGKNKATKTTTHSYFQNSFMQFYYPTCSIGPWVPHVFSGVPQYWLPAFLSLPAFWLPKYHWCSVHHNEHTKPLQTFSTQTSLKGDPWKHLLHSGEQKRGALKASGAAQDMGCCRGCCFSADTWRSNAISVAFCFFSSSH